MRVYGHHVSLRAHRVTLAAAELGLPLEHVQLDIGTGENQKPEYVAKNPMGKIPTFEDDDGWLLWESFAIVTYLGETHPEKGLFPTDPRGRAEAFRWMFWCASHLDPALVTLYVQRCLNPRRGQPTDEAACAVAMKDFARFMPVLDAHLKERPWMLGESFSLVDVAIGAGVDALFRKELGMGFDPSPFKNVTAWHGRLADRPSWAPGVRWKR